MEIHLKIILFFMQNWNHVVSDALTLALLKFFYVCIRRMCEGLCSERKEGCQKEVSENPIS